MEPSAWFRFGISAMAVWRLTNLLALEDGPWDSIVWIRQKLGATVWGNLLDCFNCLSIWISIPFAFYVVDGILGRVIVWLALSGVASVVNKMVTQPLDFEALRHVENDRR